MIYCVNSTPSSYSANHSIFFSLGIPPPFPAGVKEFKSSLTSQGHQGREKTRTAVLFPSQPSLCCCGHWPAMWFLSSQLTGHQPLDFVPSHIFAANQTYSSVSLRQGLPSPDLVPQCRHIWHWTWPEICAPALFCRLQLRNPRCHAPTAQPGLPHSCSLAGHVNARA